MEDPSLAPTQFEGAGHATLGELLEINIGTKHEPHPPHKKKCAPRRKGNLYQLLKEKKYIFIWTYMKMLSLDLEISIYLLAVRADKQPV